MLNTNKIIPVREQIAGQIRSDIIAGELVPGTKLNEQALAERFGVSRGPIRDVLLQLTQEGLGVSKNNVGSFVNDLLSPELQTLLIDIRRRIEEHAVKALKKKLEQDDFDHLEAILTDLRDSFERKDFTTVTKKDMEFHHYLVDKAGGDDLSNLWHSVVMRMRMNYQRVDSPKDCEDEHQAILSALREGNTRAAVAALRDNIR
jgi:DNA-binding GntR family transcriptional regulator